LACDLTLIPYHGQPFQELHEVYRSKPKSGTSHFHAYATAYVIRKGRRFTVALTPVRRGEALDAVLRRLLRQAARAGVRPRLLLLDRGFYTVNVIRSLQAARYPFLMPAVVRGRRPRGPQAAADVRWQKSSGWGQHTLRNDAGRTATVGIGVACRNYRGQWGRHGRQRLVYAYWGLQPVSYQWLRQTYRRRFGIETTYRQLHQARVRTTTRNPLLRLFYVGLALVLRNVWVWCHAQVLATPRRGGRRLNPERLRFKVLLLWLLHVAEETLGLCDFTDAECPFDNRV
jgi:putative transposase